MITRYAKALLYILLAAVSFLVTALTDGRIDQAELINLGLVLVGAIGVYLAPNLAAGPGRYLKGIVAFFTAALIALLSFLSDGVTIAEWMQVGVAALAGIGVVIVPNASEADRAGDTITINGVTDIDAALQAADRRKARSVRAGD